MPKKSLTIEDMQKLLAENNRALVDYLDQKIENLQEQIRLLPSKEEFFERMDRISGEYSAFSTEAPNMAKKMSDRLYYYKYNVEQESEANHNYDKSVSVRGNRAVHSDG